MRFEWDPLKDIANRTKHNVSFDAAITAFDDPFALIVPTRSTPPGKKIVSGSSGNRILAFWWSYSPEGPAADSIASSVPAAQTEEREGYMKTSNDFPFEKARRVSDKELRLARKAIAKKTGMPRPPRGRPVKPETEKYLSTSIRIHPKAMAWAKREAKRRGVGYQTVINAVLLEKAG